MRFSIRYQLLLPLLLLLLGVVGISTWTAVASARRVREDLETQMRHIAGLLSHSPFPLTERVLEMTKELSGADYLLDKGAQNPPTTLTGQDLVLPLAQTVVTDPQALQLGKPISVGGKFYLCCGLRLQKPHPDAGAVLYILHPKASLDEALWSAVRPALVLGIFGGSASILLAVGMAHRLGRRIQELVRRTSQIAAGDFSPMPLPGRNDELRDLGRSVNDMAQQLTQLQDAMKKNESLRLLGQIGGGLAHQLRNGVTGARLAVQLHARECNGHADPETLDVALRQLSLVEANLKRFLNLGMTQTPAREPCSLNSLVEETISLLKPQCRHAHCDLCWKPAPADVTVLGDPGQLQHLFLNVIGNGIEAAGTGGRIEVAVRLDDGEWLKKREATNPSGTGKPEPPCALVQVSDSGDGPPPDVAQRLFEPFVTGKRDGVGLGLAVARQVVEGHGGAITWSRVASQTCFSIRLPIQP